MLPSVETELSNVLMNIGEWDGCYLYYGANAPENITHNRRVSLSLFARLCGIKVGFRPQEVFSVQGSQLENTRGI